MSQIISFGQGGGGGGGDVLTLTGNTGGAVGPTGGNINVLGNGTLQVVGTPGSSTLTIYDTTKDEVQVTTFDDTPTSLFSIPLAVNSCLTLEALINVAQDDFSAGGYCQIVAAARRISGGAILIGVPSVATANDFSDPISVNAVVSGNNLVIQVVGIAATTITWKGVINNVSIP